MTAIINSVPAEVLDFVLDDYQENIYSSGDVPCPSAEELSFYWDQFVSDCATWGRPVPANLTPELYHDIWMQEYARRTGNCC